MNERGLQLRIKGVRFDPWQGLEFKSGIRNRKILIIGEAHYGNYANGGAKTLTQSIIRDHAIQRKVRSLRYYTMLQRLFSDDDVWTKDGRGDFWNSVAFYNYVQVLVPDARKEPTPEQWETGITPILPVIERINPDAIVVTGLRLWAHLAEHVTLRPLGRKGLFTLTLRSGRKIPVACIAHPSSSAFRYRVEAPKVDALLRRPIDRKGR
jgi:hypothetical protein